jgi:hypothetical protein
VRFIADWLPSSRPKDRVNAGSEPAGKIGRFAEAAESLRIEEVIVGSALHPFPPSLMHHSEHAAIAARCRLPSRGHEERANPIAFEERISQDPRNRAVACNPRTPMSSKVKTACRGTPEIATLLAGPQLN